MSHARRHSQARLGLLCERKGPTGAKGGTPGKLQGALSGLPVQGEMIRTSRGGGVSRAPDCGLGGVGAGEPVQACGWRRVDLVANSRARPVGTTRPGSEGAWVTSVGSSSVVKRLDSNADSNGANIWRTVVSATLC